jgi:NAD(P)-dependent dehydrogenase (short-subunit alcohol dehydrogenase family)
MSDAITAETGRPTPAFPLPHNSTDLTGQVALVTGASAGLGRRFARVLAACGASVAVGARRLDKLNDLAAEIEAEDGTCLPVELDMTDAAQIEAAVSEIEAALGTVSILVNNAGTPDARRAHRMPLETVDAVLATNLRGPYLLSCEVARHLISAGKPGRIVNISAMSSFQYDGSLAASLYATTKGGLNRMTEVLAVEWVKHNINVNAIAPGVFSSEMVDGMISRVGDPTADLPRKRIGDPAQLDSSLLFLVGPGSDFVTGTIIRVDDGQYPR